MFHQKSHFGLGAILLLFLSAPLYSQDPAQDLKKEIQELKKGQQQIRRQLQQLRQLILTRLSPKPSGPKVRNVVFELGDNPVVGEDTAPLTLVEFTDYQ